MTLDNFEVVDEKTSLLKAEGGSLAHGGSLVSLTGSTPAPAISQLSRPASASQLNIGAGSMGENIAKTSSAESVPVGERSGTRKLCYTTFIYM